MSSRRRTYLNSGILDRYRILGVNNGNYLGNNFNRTYRLYGSNDDYVAKWEKIYELGAFSRSGSISHDAEIYNDSMNGSTFIRWTTGINGHYRASYHSIYIDDSGVRIIDHDIRRNLRASPICGDNPIIPGSTRYYSIYQNSSDKMSISITDLFEGDGQVIKTFPEVEFGEYQKGIFMRRGKDNRLILFSPNFHHIYEQEYPDDYSSFNRYELLNEEGDVYKSGQLNVLGKIDTVSSESVYIILSYGSSISNSSNGLYKFIDGKLTRYLSFKDKYLENNYYYDMGHDIIYVDEINNGSIYSIRRISYLQIAVDVVYNIKSESFVYDSCLIKLEGPVTNEYQLQISKLYHCKSSNRVIASIAFSSREDYGKKLIQMWDVTDVDNTMEIYYWPNDGRDDENNVIFTVG